MPSSDKKRILVLNVDRDDDIGKKAGFKTPLIGKESIIKAAESLLINDPEDADGNALFGALKVYKELQSKGENVEVAAISGSPSGGLDADKKIVEELNEIIRTIRPAGVVLVTDGFSDEEIIPIVGTRIPIISVRRIVVKHSRSVEETYAILGRYLRMIWNEFPYRLYFIAIPGTIFLLIGILSLLQLTQVAMVYSLIILGLAMMIKGLGIDEYIQSLRKAHMYEYIRLATYIGASAAFLTGLYISYLSINGLPEVQQVAIKPELFWKYGAKITGFFLPPFLGTVLVVSLIYALGMVLYNLLYENYEALFKYPIVIEAVIFFYFVGLEISKILITPSIGFSQLILYFIIGLSILFLTTAVMYFLHKKRRRE